MIDDRLEKQVQFLLEIDKLKHITRQNYLADGSRKENDAEHSWHLAIMTILLSEHSLGKNIDVLHVLKMVLIHDLVEIYAGDTYCYDKKGNEDKLEREEKAADKLFSMLPLEQGQELRRLWEEFEERKTPEACFAVVMDRFEPLLLNYNSKGKSWIEHGVSKQKVLERNKYVKQTSSIIGNYIEKIINDSTEKDYLKNNSK